MRIASALSRAGRYSAFALARHGLTGARWPRAWRSPDPKRTYDVIIIGGGGHGLATAYYLASRHGISNVAVLERHYIGSGNVGRNTTLVRSNYLMDGNTQFFEHSLKLWEGLSHELNYNVMLSQRGQVVLAHSPAQLDVLARKGNIMRLNGIDAELLRREELMRLLPYLDYSAQSRFPIYGAVLQRRAGTVRHDAVAWGYARGADALGVDSSRTARSPALRATASITGSLPAAARLHGAARGSRWPAFSQIAAPPACACRWRATLLRAFVTEPIKPFVNT